jgi:hypothetical protein
MIRSNNLLPLVAAIFLAVAAPASAQVYDTFVIPAVGNTQGGGGTVWASEVTIFNPQAYTLFVSMTFLPSGLDQGSEVLVQIPSNQFFVASNVLNEVYHRSGTGSLVLAAWPEDNKHVPNPSILDLSFVVRSNTFNNASSGTYGQAIPGVISGLMDFSFEQLSAVTSGVRNFGQPNVNGFRTNVGALNLGRCTVHMRVNVYDELGRTVAKDLPFDVPPLGHVQDKLPTTIDRGTLEYFIDDPCVGDTKARALVFAYASVVDNKSGDPVYFDPILLANPSYLYPAKALPKDPLTVGKKIDKDFAGRVRDRAERVGIATMLTRDDGTRSVTVTR